MATAGKAKIFANCLADDCAARVQNARCDRRVHIWHVALQRRRAVHHRHAGQAHIVLQYDLLSLELPRGCPATVVLRYQAACVFSSPDGRYPTARG